MSKASQGVSGYGEQVRRLDIWIEMKGLPFPRFSSTRVRQWFGF